MTEPLPEPAQAISRHEASDAVAGIGWRYVLGVLRTRVATPSLDRSAEVVSVAVAAVGAGADGHLWFDVRSDQVVMSLQSLDEARVTRLDIDLAHRITAALTERGLRTDPAVGARQPSSLQIIEVAIDALDIPAVRPFWRAVLGYEDEPGLSGISGAIVDPTRQGPAVWFQQMDTPRPQRNRIHLDVSVPHDEASARIDAALAAGGVLVSDNSAPAFWVLADPEGNEACITTWQGRD